MEGNSLIGSRWFDIHCRNSKYVFQVIKCDDKSCCGETKSDIKMVLSNFLPPPLSIKNTPKISYDINGKFVSLLLAIKLPKTILTDWLVESDVPYDYCCPSMNGKIMEFTCKKCKKYFATLYILKLHVKTAHQTTLIKKVRPIRVAAKRQREMMVKIASDELEWMDESDLEMEDPIIAENEESNCQLEEIDFKLIENDFL